MGKSIRLSTEDLRLLDEAGEILGAESRVDAIRVMARTVVEASRARASEKASRKTSTKASKKTSTKASKKAPSKKAKKATTKVSG